MVALSFAARYKSSLIGVPAQESAPIIAERRATQGEENRFGDDERSAEVPVLRFRGR